MAISKKLLNDDERLIHSSRQHPKVLFGPVLLLVLMVVVGVLLQVVLGNDTLRIIVWVLVLIGAVWLFVVPFVTWLATVYGFTDRRIITRQGVLTRRGHDIPLSRISDIESESEVSLLDRMFGCGSLLISDASTNGTTRLNDIPRVEAVQKELNEVLHQLHETGRVDDA